MLITRRSLLHVSALALASSALPKVASAAPLPSLPVALANVKALMLATNKVPTINVSPFYSINSQLLKCGELIFSPGGICEFAALDFDWVALYADLITLTGPATIRRTSSIKLDGTNGINGKAAPPPRPGYGRNGLDGEPGGPGGEGHTQRVPIIYIFCQQVLLNGVQARPSDVGGTSPSSPFTLVFDGYPGGKGGSGGNGGAGSNGTQGTPSEDGWLDCSAGPGWGGRGGNGGTSGTPGIGGNGSDGSAIYAFVQPSQEAVFDVLPYSVKGGALGQNGVLGSSGRGGKGGPEGAITSHCNSAKRKGDDGKVPAPCALPEIHAHQGMAGPKPSVTPYTGFAELNA